MKRITMLVIFLLSCGKGNVVDPQQFSGQSGLGGGNNCLVEVQHNEQIEGTLELVFIDDFHSPLDKTQSYLITADDEKILLHGNALLHNIPVGSQLRLTGKTMTPRIQLTDDSVPEREFLVDHVQLLTGSSFEIKSYGLKTLMLIMDFSNRATSSIYPLAQGQKDLKDIADYYRRVSGNQIDMKTDVNGDGEQDVEVVTMDGSFSSSYCTPYLDNFVKNKVTKHSFDDYTTVIFVAAQTKSGNDPVCGYGGVANVGQLGSGLKGRTHIGIPLNSVTVHELGHTFGLGHSGKAGCTYCDQVDPMGNYFGNLFQYFNGPKIKQLGLFDNRTELEHIITSSGIYPISAVGLGMKSGNTTPRLLTINGATPHYLTYRHPSGEDADLPSSLSSFRGIVVNTGSIAGGGQSVYHKVLKFNGDSYASGDLTIKLLSDINNPEAEVEVIINGSSGGATPSPEPKCLSSKVITRLQHIKNVGNNTFEVSYDVDNQNSSFCSKLDYTLSLDSTDFELAEPSAFSISAGQKINVITKIRIKAGIDLSQEKSTYKPN